MNRRNKKIMCHHQMHFIKMKQNYETELKEISEQQKQQQDHLVGEELEQKEVFDIEHQQSEQEQEVENDSRNCSSSGEDEAHIPILYKKIMRQLKRRKGLNRRCMCIMFLEKMYQYAEERCLEKMRRKNPTFENATQE